MPASVTARSPRGSSASSATSVACAEGDGRARAPRPGPAAPGGSVRALRARPGRTVVITAPASISAFPHRKAGHCGSGALRDLLELHGLDYGHGPLSEGAAFGFGGGLGFLYLELPRMRPPVYLVGRTGSLERDIAPHLGIGLEVRSTDDPEEGWRWVREQIDAGSPPMVWADIAELEYLNVRMSNTRHDIVVVAYDERAGVAWVADNDREELQACSLEALARARNSGAFPGPNRHTTFLYAWPERLRDPGEAVRDALRKAVENMRGTGGPPMPGMEDRHGLAGVECFAAAYPRWPETFGDDLDACLSALRVFIVKAGTGGAMFRSLHAGFLHDAAEILGDAGLRDLAGLYDGLAAAWIELAGHAAERDHAAGVAVAERIAGLERAGVEAMERRL